MKGFWKCFAALALCACGAQTDTESLSGMGETQRESRILRGGDEGEMFWREEFIKEVNKVLIEE